jgi:hypothetical protein
LFPHSCGRNFKVLNENLENMPVSKKESARKKLSIKIEKQPRSALGTFVPTDKSWDQYCEQIGSSRRVVNL